MFHYYTIILNPGQFYDHVSVTVKIVEYTESAGFATHLVVAVLQ